MTDTGFGLIRQKMAFVSVISLFAMAYVDYSTGYELVFSAAYLIPVSLCAWYFGKRTVVWMSVASGTAAFVVDAIDGHSFSHFMVQYWNSFMCFAISLLTGLLLCRLKRTLEEHKQTNQNLKETLEELQRSTEEIRRYKTGCRWCAPGPNKLKWATAG